MSDSSGDCRLVFEFYCSVFGGYFLFVQKLMAGNRHPRLPPQVRRFLASGDTGSFLSVDVCKTEGGEKIEEAIRTKFGAGAGGRRGEMTDSDAGRPAPDSNLRLLVRPTGGRKHESRIA